MSKRGKTERIGDILADLLARKSYGKPLAHEGLSKAWARAAGQRLAGSTRVATYRDGILTIEVESAAQRYELEAFGGPELLALLQRDETIPDVRKLVFRVGDSTT